MCPNVLSMTIRILQVKQNCRVRPAPEIENVIGAPKMLNNYMQCYQIIFFFNIAKAVLQTFSTVIAFDLHYFIFGICSLLLFLIALSIFIALPISIAVPFLEVIAKCFCYFKLLPLSARKSNSWKSDNYMGTIKKRSHKQCTIPIKKISKRVKSDNFCHRKV